MKKLLFFALLLPHFTIAQKYLVLFKDKNNTTFSLTNPSAYLSQRAIDRRKKQGISIKERDLPPNTTYVNQVIAAGGKVFYQTKWLNGVVVQANDSILNKILKLPFVKGIDGNLPLKYSSIANTSSLKRKLTYSYQRTASPDLGLATNQLQMLGADKMIAQGYHGEGMYVAILDNGFLNADKVPFLTTLFTEKRVLTTYDFVQNSSNVYNSGDGHGTSCLSIMAAYQDSVMIGAAYKASYVLFATEDDDTESRLEEANWLIAAEKADSIGVDVISTSLGYNQFDNSTQDYTYSDMNGHTTLASRAASIAAEVGILVVAAAGNDGAKPWHYIGTPADADSIIAVGAVSEDKFYVDFSSVGPASDGRIKPELAAKGLGTTRGTAYGDIAAGSGTSFATPLIAGLATGLWQAFPNFTNIQIRKYLIRSASQYNNPDDLLGYGIPNFQLAYDLAKKENPILTSELGQTKIVQVYPNPVNDFNEVHILIKDSTPKLNYQLTLYDLSGNKIWEGNSTEKDFFLPFSKKSSVVGTYLLKISNENSSTTFRIFKQ